MIIDHESKFIFVAVAKTACTSIQRSVEITHDPEPTIYHIVKAISRGHTQFKNTKLLKSSL